MVIMERLTEEQKAGLSIEVSVALSKLLFETWVWMGSN